MSDSPKPPERVWISGCFDGREWVKAWCSESFAPGATAWIRADLLTAAEARIAELEAIEGAAAALLYQRDDSSQIDQSPEWLALLQAIEAAMKKENP